MLVGVVFYVLMLLGIMFLAHEQETQIRRAATNHSSDLVRRVWLRTHFQAWETEPSRAKLVSQLIRDADPLTEFKHEILALDESDVERVNTRHVIDPAEEALLKTLETTFKADGFKSESTNAQKPFVDDVAAHETEYRYYEALHWRTSCFACHQSSASSAVPIDLAESRADEMPFRVVKITTPYEPVRKEIAKSRRRVVTWIGVLSVAFAALLFVFRFQDQAKSRPPRQMPQAAMHSTTVIDKPSTG